MDSGFEISPWQLRWRGVDPAALQRAEAVFALANGHIGFRGSFEEGAPRALPGTYLNGFCEEHPLPYAEVGYGNPEKGQTIVNVTNGKIIRLLVDDEPLDMRYGPVCSNSRILDFRSGTLRRRTEWESPTGVRILISSERMVSFTQRAVAAIRFEVQPVEQPVHFVLQSDLLANEHMDGPSDDPRVSSVLESPLVADVASCKGYRALLAHHTRRTGLRVAAAIDHEVEVPGDVWTDIEARGDVARLTVATDVAPGQKLQLTKYIAYGWSGHRATPDLTAQVEAALAGARLSGWDGLLNEQREYLDDFWDTADVEIDGDPELQQAVRFALFHVLQAGARGETRAIPAKGLTGPGYDGHSFWDSETFVLPVLTYTVPEAARDALRWRFCTLDKARTRARQLGLSGAAFPWRSINGHESSGYWPAGTAAFHINADIADAVVRYLEVTGDQEFERQCGLELLVETARLWVSLGYFETPQDFRIDGVTGPDEYSAVVDNNVFTNLMAQRNLWEAAARCERCPSTARRLGVSEEEPGLWRRAADRMVIPYDRDLGVHSQAEGFTHHASWNFQATPAESYPLMLHHPYFDLYRKQVVKQADLVHAMFLRGEAFSAAQKAANMAYYEPLTVRDSSLSASTQAVLAAEVGDLDLAYDYLAEAALADLHDTQRNIRDGLHIASLAGSWIGVVAGFGGLRVHGGVLTFVPRLPHALSRIAFRMSFGGSRVSVAIRPNDVTYCLTGPVPLEIKHHATAVTLTPHQPVTLSIPPPPEPPVLRQPPGRAPEHRAQENEGGSEG